jgi:hypothetical protein
MSCDSIRESGQHGLQNGAIVGFPVIFGRDATARLVEYALSSGLRFAFDPTAISLQSPLSGAENCGYFISLFRNA